MISLNKLLMSVIVATTVVVKAEETAKFEVVTQQIYAAFKKFCTNVTSQENVDKAKDYTNKALEQTEKVFTQYPMYIPAIFFFGRASMAAKIAHTENLSKELSKALKRTKSRNMWIGGGLSLGHLYYNRNEKPVTVNSVENKQEKVLPTEKNEPAA
jgi:hypothetical protein